MPIDSNLAQILAFLGSKGLTPAQAAGVAGNLKIESGYSPTAYNANEGAIGIAQWEGGRRTQLQAYAAQMGGKETDLKVQLAFLWHELTGRESSAYAALKGTTTAADAAAVFDQKYERSAGTARQARISEANTIYTTIGYASLNGPAFRGSQGAAFTTDGDTGGGNLSWWDWLVPWSDANAPGMPQVEIPDPVKSGKMVYDNITDWLQDNLLKFMVAAAGMALVVVGLGVAAKPAIQKAAQVAGDVASTVKPI